LPDHKYCRLELCVACPADQWPPAPEACLISEPRLNTLGILGELVAEGWAKAVDGWKKRHQLPVRFDARPQAPPTVAAKPPGSVLAKEETPLDP
jgi:hypothetical protein